MTAKKKKKKVQSETEAHAMETKSSLQMENLLWKSI